MNKFIVHHKVDRNYNRVLHDEMPYGESGDDKRPSTKRMPITSLRIGAIIDLGKFSARQGVIYSERLKEKIYEWLLKNAPESLSKEIAQLKQEFNRFENASGEEKDVLSSSIEKAIKSIDKGLKGFLEKQEHLLIDGKKIYGICVKTMVSRYIKQITKEGITKYFESKNYLAIVCLNEKGKPQIKTLSYLEAMQMRATIVRLQQKTGRRLTFGNLLRERFGKILMSLHIGEIVKCTKDKHAGRYLVMVKSQPDEITFIDHDNAKPDKLRENGENIKLTAANVHKWGVEKVRVGYNGAAK
jgi:hypothetical protein